MLVYSPLTLISYGQFYKLYNGYHFILSTTQSQPPPRAAGIMRDFRQSCRSNFGWPLQQVSRSRTQAQENCCSAHSKPLTCTLEVFQIFFPILLQKNASNFGWPLVSSLKLKFKKIAVRKPCTLVVFSDFLSNFAKIAQFQQSAFYG